MIENKEKKLPSVRKLNRWPALIELIQATTGLALVLFIWTHSFLVASILISDKAMYNVARFFEGYYVFGRPYPILVSAIAVIIFALVVIHAVLAIRKIPGSYREYNALRQHLKTFKHTDTLLWAVQVITGLLLMFFVSIHLYQMFSHPAGIGPYASADRIWSDSLWPVYLILLFSAEIHGGIGVYRLILKWGWFGLDKNNKTTVSKRRNHLKLILLIIVSFFLILGTLTLATEVRKGIAHADKAGERYDPAKAEVNQQ